MVCDTRTAVSILEVLNAIQQADIYKINQVSARVSGRDRCDLRPVVVDVHGKNVKTIIAFFKTL